jgi:hypothetical protein
LGIDTAAGATGVGGAGVGAGLGGVSGVAKHQLAMLVSAALSRRSIAAICGASSTATDLLGGAVPVVVAKVSPIFSLVSSQANTGAPWRGHTAGGQLWARIV